MTAKRKIQILIDILMTVMLPFLMAYQLIGEAIHEYTAELLGNEVISEIAQAHGKSSAQIILRWNLQKGVVVIPGSSNPEHIRENTELFDFELTEEEMERIGGLDRNEKHDWY